MRRIGVVTVARSDYGIYLPILRRIQQDPELELFLFVSGMHLSPEFGLTVQAIEADGFEVGDRLEMLLSSDTPQGISKSVGLGMISFAQSYERHRPDLLLVLGDRFEMLAAVVAALPFKIPIAHLHGGEATEGAIDESIRHAITKMSHLHFVSTAAYAQRVMQMGEEPWRVVVSGAPSLDNLRMLPLLERTELEQRFGLTLQDPFLLVTFHPVTLQYEQTATQIGELLTALEQWGMPVVFTYPNADTSSRVIIQCIQEFVQRHPQQAQATTNLGTQGYFSLMNLATAMVGNSSSGIIEAASFRLPVINIGDRQRGRVRARNVIDTGHSAIEILSALQQADTPEFRASLQNLENPYGNGQAAECIVQGLQTFPLKLESLMKPFYSFGESLP